MKVVRVRKSFIFHPKKRYDSQVPSEQHSCDWNDHPDPHLPCFNKRRLAVAHVEERPAWKDKPMDTHGWSFVTFDHLFRGAIIFIQFRSNPYAFEEIKQAWSKRSKELFPSLLRCQHKTLQEGVFAALQHAICTGHSLLADVSSVARLKSR